jgi:hypothetical protein
MQRQLTVVVGILLASIVAGRANALTTTNWTEDPSNPIYAPGHKAYYETVLKEGDTYTMWYASSGGLKVTSSADGFSWGASSDCTGLTNPNHALVENIGGTYRVWYWPGLSYSINDIRTATSSDGIAWTSDQPITQVGSTVIDNSSSGNWNRGSYGPADVLYNPSGSSTIVEPTDETSVWVNKYVLYYDGSTGGSESIGLAVSNDGLNWRGYNGGVAPVLAGTGVAGDWDRTYVSRCTVIKENDDAYHMWYSGGDGRMDHGIGYAFSTDGIVWTRDALNPILYKDDGLTWRSDRTYCPIVIGDEMWFTGKSDAGIYAVGYASGAEAPIPEPAGLGLLGLGLLGVARRKKRS